MTTKGNKKNKTAAILLRIIPIIIIVIISLYFFTDVFTTKENGNADEQIDQLGIEALSELIIKALAERDMETIATYVDPEQGLLFSPYVYVTEDAVVFEKATVSSMLTSKAQFNWGDYDGKGSPIELTPADYFDEFMDMNAFINKDDVLIDDLQDRGNTLNNIKEVYPDARVVEYYHDGSEEYAGIDWSSIILVYQESDAGGFTLIAIIRDMWTI